MTQFIPFRREQAFLLPPRDPEHSGEAVPQRRVVCECRQQDVAPDHGEPSSPPLHAVCAIFPPPLAPA